MNISSTNISAECNLKCSYCSANSPTAEHNMMSAKTIKIIDNIVSENCIMVCISGLVFNILYLLDNFAAMIIQIKSPHKYH